MKKLIAPVALAAILFLTSCSGTASTSTGDADSKTTEVAQAVPDLTGSWIQSNAATEDSYQQATITDEAITVEWVTDGGETTSVYWVGTFQAPTADGPHSWVSKRDKAATESALLASSDETKEFTYADDKISYKVSALGTTTTVKLQKR